MSTDATPRAVPRTEPGTPAGDTDMADAMDAMLLLPLQRQNSDDRTPPAPATTRTLALPEAVRSVLPLLRGVRAVVGLCLAATVASGGLATLSRPALATSAFLVALGISAVQPLLLGPRASATLTSLTVATVAMPPLLRNLWLAAGIPQVVTRALVDGQFVPLSSPTLRVGPLSPVPAVHGLAGLVLAAVAVLVVSAASRQARTAIPRLTLPTAGRSRSFPTSLPTSLPASFPASLPTTFSASWSLSAAALRSAVRLARTQLASRVGRGVAGEDPFATAVRPVREASRDGVPTPRAMPRGRAHGDLPVPLPSQATLLEHATGSLQRTDLAGGDVALFVLQIDRFDGLADALGPAAADDLVRQVARRLRAWLPADDVVARLGTGTFGVLVEGVAQDGCDRMARRMTALLREPMTCDGHTLSVTFSIGIATSRDDLESAEALLRGAYEALDVAQRGGRARWATFDGEHRARALSQGTLELDLRKALRERRIGVAFQPMVRLAADPADDRVIAMEALARWSTPDGTAVPPLTFVPLAEEIGLGPALGLQVLSCGLDAVAGWYAQDHAVGRLAVNLAQSQLDDPHFVRTLHAQLERRALPPSCLVVEVASAAFTPTATAVATLHTLRGLGVEVLLDDFGVQGLSLAALAALPLSGVKLDRSITMALLSPDVDGSEDGDTSQGLPPAALALCRALGLRCVLEGIESQAQLDAARALGVDAVQGFFLARPSRARDVTTMLDTARRG